MKLNNRLLNTHTPSAFELEKYNQIWKDNIIYTAIQNALDELFLKIFPYNLDMSDILIKVSALNDFYSTNILGTYRVAAHYLSIHIDERLAQGDLTVVDDLAELEINGKPYHFYSFATKYCSHHKPDVYPIYDSYVHRLLRYYQYKDSFSRFTEKDLRQYESFVTVLNKFRQYYRLEGYRLCQLDKYLWLLGKEAFSVSQKE